MILALSGLTHDEAPRGSAAFNVVQRIGVIAFNPVRDLDGSMAGTKPATACGRAPAR
ncbi:hypothetical protein [Nonomuraea sp. GTA35]|uniref:hypothetical protein n=1 Tax=Nonomuraea sp. GTA35 TaxID=1676746 RepID=UPI0035C050AA